MTKHRLLIFSTLLAIQPALQAEDIETEPSFKLAGLFTDHGVLQRNKPIPVWGMAQPNTKVTVNFAGKSVETTSLADGKWKVQLPSLKAGGPYDLSVTANGKTLKKKEVMVGEVWLCSGQSNMEWTMLKTRKGAVANAEQDVAKANIPNLRFFTVQRATSRTPITSVRGKWENCTPASAAGFSATGFYFGKKLAAELDGVTIGLIKSAWGGTRVETWVETNALKKASPELSDEIAKTQTSKKINANNTSVLYNAMINPLLPYGIRGSIWYQGESNVAKYQTYNKRFTAMVANWREKFGQGNFPFYFVQIAPFRYSKDKPTQAASLRESQRLSEKSIPNSAMIVLMDAGMKNNIHPVDKKTPGERLALHALAKDYGKKVAYQRATFTGTRVEGKNLRVLFDHAEGLMSKGDITAFELAGADGIFHPATAKIENSTIIVSSEKVDQPRHVRYCWLNFIDGQLWNKDGFPVSSFSSQ